MKLLYGIGGLSYGNSVRVAGSARTVGARSYWMSASGVDKSALHESAATSCS